MKKILSLFLVLIPLMLMLSCDRDNPISNQISTPQTGKLGQETFPTLTVHFVIVQSYHLGGSYTLVDETYSYYFPSFHNLVKTFVTLGNEYGREGCDFTAYCNYIWTDYDYWDPYALNGSFILPPDNYPLLVPPTCPPDPNNPNYHPPCSGENSETVMLDLQKNTTYQYQIGFEGLQENK